MNMEKRGAYNITIEDDYYAMYMYGKLTRLLYIARYSSGMVMVNGYSQKFRYSTRKYEGNYTHTPPPVPSEVEPQVCQ